MGSRSSSAWLWRPEYRCVGTLLLRHWQATTHVPHLFPWQTSLPLPAGVQLDWEAILSGSPDQFVENVKVSPSHESDVVSCSQIFDHRHFAGSRLWRTRKRFDRRGRPPKPPRARPHSSTSSSVSRLRKSLTKRLPARLVRSRSTSSWKTPRSAWSSARRTSGARGSS